MLQYSKEIKKLNVSVSAASSDAPVPVPSSDSDELRGLVSSTGPLKSESVSLLFDHTPLTDTQKAFLSSPPSDILRVFVYILFIYCL